jgi:Trk-type K+ transport system membrane component
MRVPSAAASNLGLDPGGKSLRYYAALVPQWPLTLKYIPGNHTLRISGYYGMVK